MQHHNYSLQELENMIPWEREVYVSMLLDYLNEQKTTNADEAAESKA